MPHTIPAFEFRRRARAAMKPVMPILLMVALIAVLPSLLSNAITLMADADPNVLLEEFSNRWLQILEQEEQTAEAMNEALVGMTAIMQEKMETFLKEKGLLLGLLSLMTLVLSPVLTLGMHNAALHALRRQPFSAQIALSRLPQLLKALGLEILVVLKVILWMLPGYGVMLLGAFLPSGLMALTLTVGMIAAIVPGVMAAFRYALAVYVLADVPGTSIRGCIRRSCEVMQRRKMELFGLEISFLGWMLLLSLVQSMLLSFGVVIGMTLGMFASLFLTVYQGCAVAAFYQEYAVGPLPETAAATQQEDGNEDLN